MDAQALINAGRQVDLSRIPLWSANKEKDSFTAEQWIERIQKARVAGNWTEPATMSYVFNAMRGDALTWYDALPTLGYNNEEWNSFKEAFLRTYGTTRTVRTAALNLSDIRQAANEPAAKYIARVIKIITDLKAMAPEHIPEPAQPWTAAVSAVADFVALTAAQKSEQQQRLLQHGSRDAYNRLGMQLFIAGLKPLLRTELMKSNPDNMREAFDAVLDAERIIAEPNKSGHQRAVVAPVNDEGDLEEDDRDGDDPEEGDEDADVVRLAAIQQRAKLLKKKIAHKNKKKNNQGQQQKAGQQQKQSGSPPNSNSSSNGQAGEKDKCRYCNRPGHRQANCFKRKAAGAPMVDQFGRAYQSGVNGIAGPMQHPYSTPPPQQQQMPGPAYYPYASYAQNEQRGEGVGAIWNRNEGEGQATYNHLKY